MSSLAKGTEKFYCLDDSCCFAIASSSIRFQAFVRTFTNATLMTRRKKNPVSIVFLNLLSVLNSVFAFLELNKDPHARWVSEMAREMTERVERGIISYCYLFYNEQNISHRWKKGFSGVGWIAMLLKNKIWKMARRGWWIRLWKLFNKAIWW